MSAVMKARLAEWISEGVTIMNEKKREKVVHCWEKTGLLAIWDINKRSVLAPQAFAQTARLFPGRDNDDMRSTTQRQKNQLILAVQQPRMWIQKQES